MAAPYSEDLRLRVLAAHNRGMETRVIATMFEVSPAWARRIKQRRREKRELMPRRTGCPGVRKFNRTRLSELVREDPDATLMELRDRLGVRVAMSAISAALQALGLAFKKDDPCGRA